MKVALFTDTYPPQINGVATATATLAEALRKNGNEVLVVTVSVDGQKHITKKDGIVRIPGITLKWLYKYKMAGVFSKRVYDYLKEFAPDVIHVQTEMGIGIFGRIAAHNLNVPLVYTYHTMYEDYTYYVTKGWRPFDKVAKKVVASFSALVSDTTTEFITTSDKTKEALKRYGVKKFINVVPNGIDLSSFKVDDDNKVSEIKKKYNLENKYTLLILGRLAKEKSNETILKFLSSYLLKVKDDSIRLLIVGDGPDKPDLEELSKKLHIDKQVIFVGSVEHKDVPSYYKAANLYISASTSETQGLTYIEAMASNLLVMAKFDFNLVNTIIDKKTGFFFTDESSFQEVFNTVRSLNDEQVASIKKAATDNIYQKFSLETYYERIINVYKKALRRYW